MAVPALIVLGVLAVLYASGADRAIMIWALEGQRGAQDGMASSLQALRRGEAAALTGFLAVCFAYGVFHAAGPGHGKLVIAGYGAARAIGAVRLAAVALISSLAQGGTAIALVGAGLWVWSLSRAQMTDLADRLLTPLSYAAIALVGLWLVWRGARGLAAAPAVAQAGRHAHDHQPSHPHDAGDDCAVCGHAHVPDPARLAAAQGWRDVVFLVAAVAIRPCTGALFILILTAQMGIFAIGVAGTLAMALGTALITSAVALTAVTMRRGVLAGLADSPALARIQRLIEIAMGTLVAVTGGQLALASI